MATATAEHEIGEKGPFGRVWDGEKFARPAKAAPSEPVAAATPDLAAIIRDSIAAAVAPLQAKIEELESRPSAPQFQKMDPALGMDFSVAERRAVMKKGDGGEESLPMGADGHRVPDQVLLMVPRRFKPGQPVRVRRDMVRAGMKDNMSWGELMDKLGTVRCPTKSGTKQCIGRFHVGDACPVCGQGPKVLKLGFLNDTVGDWVLKVRVPGMTTSYGMAFYSQELEAA